MNRLKVWTVLFGLAAALCAPVAAAGSDEESIPRQVIAADISTIGRSDFDSTNGWGARQSVLEGNISFLQRNPVSGGPWYWGCGARSDIFSFSNHGTYPLNHLQDYAGQFSLEYFVKSQPAASLTLYPGFYYENTPTLSAWDVPFELVSGIPISSSIAGVIGVNWGRFYYLPVPIAGFSWTVNPKVRVDLVYPNPSLVVELKKNLEARISGELIGSGYRTDDIPGKSHVEYFEYRVGAHLATKLKPGLKLEVGAGYCVDRTFEFLPDRLTSRTDGAPFAHIGLEWAR